MRREAETEAATEILIIYDSGFGNTARIAEAIAQGAQATVTDADHVALHHISDVRPEHAAAANLLFIGSPTQGFRSIAPVRYLLAKTARDELAGTRLAAFDTRFTEDEIRSIGRMLCTMVALWLRCASHRRHSRQKGGAPNRAARKLLCWWQRGFAA